ncbi:hypothetical protein ACFOSV_04795 [Algoriphagus namhaensis]|uniref:Arylesterase n=1 Tax=Algoriphagus namhaensis TaxID=915353 RepID=A0ABV8ARN0_9BACT
MKKFLLVLLLLLIALVAFVLYIFNSTGFFREVVQKNDFGVIHGQIDLPGVEDIALARVDSLLILSVDDRATRREGKSGPTGIYLVELRNPAFEPVDLTQDLDFPFFPHGISLYQTDSAAYSLAVINHVDGEHSVEIFHLRGKSLTHQKTIRDENFISPNDLVLVSPDQFYYSNDHGYRSGIGVFAENYLGLKASNVGFFDGEKVEIKAEGIGYANGIQFDLTNKTLYVAAVRSFSVLVYSVDENWNLNLDEELDAGTGVDNIELDDAGTLWIGAHPNLLRFASYAAGKEETAPSEVLKISYENGQSKIESVYTDTGEKVSGSSVAVPWGDYLFIGNVMDSKVLILKK